MKKVFIQTAISTAIVIIIIAILASPVLPLTLIMLAIYWLLFWSVCSICFYPDSWLHCAIFHRKHHRFLNWNPGPPHSVSSRRQYACGSCGRRWERKI